MKSNVVRINDELVQEINRIAKKNQMKFVEASKEVASELKRKKGKRVLREIQF